MKRRAELLEMPEHILFSLKDIAYSPESPRKEEPFTVTGKMELFGIPFPFPVWIIVTVTYPERWWEEITPIIGAREVREFCMALGGDFELTFKKGFLREGEFGLAVRLYPGPSFPIDTIVFTPTPAFATEETTFIVGGEVPPEEVGFRTFRILSYAKNGGAPVSPPEVLELDVGDRLQIKLGFDHRDLAVTGKIHAAIWQETFVDPHDEVLNKEKTFSVPASDDWEPHEEGIEIIITSDIAPGTEYGLYAKIMGITGGDIFTNYLENVITIIGPPELGFDLTKPTVSKTPVDPGTPIDITCPVKSTCSESVDATAKIIIYEGSIAPGHGDTLKEYDSGVFHINPGETQNVILTNHVTVVGTIDRRDVEVEVYVEGRKIKESEWDDVFKVIQPPEIPTSDIGPLDRFSVEEGTYDLGDTVPWSLPYTYKGKAQSGWLTISLGTGPIGTFFTKHTFPRIPISFEEAYDWTEFHESGSFTLPTTLEPGQKYTVRAKLETADGKQETDTDWGVITIEEVPVIPTSDLHLPDPGFEATPGTYDLGDRVDWTMVYRYKGKTQGGWLTISLGTGLVGTFFTKHTFPRIAVGFQEAYDWAPGELFGTFTLPATLDPGQTYNVRAKLETADGKQETDTDWGVITIIEIEEYTLSVSVEPYGGGRVTASPSKTAYTAGERVTLTATPYSGYEFDKWSGDASGYSSSIAIYMNKDMSIIANFKKTIPPPTTKVSFTVKGDGFPFATSYWKLYHYDRDGNIWQDYTLHRPGDIIPVRNVQSAGRFACHCCNLFTGEWSEQFYSVEFAAIDGEDYEYDIASGIVYYR